MYPSPTSGPGGQAVRLGRDVPWSVASHLAAELGIADPGILKQYAAREGTNRLHAGEIQHAYGYRDRRPSSQQDLVGWLEARARLASERPSVLFNLATARLLEEGPEPGRAEA